MKKRWAAFLMAAVLAAVLFPARSWAVELAGRGAGGAADGEDDGTGALRKK